MKNPTIKMITRAALLLALCVVLQLTLPTELQAVKGPAVNIVLLMAAFSVSLPYAVAIAVINPIFVLLISPPALMLICPQIVLTVMLGNATFVVCAGALKDYLMGIPALVVACLAKTGIMILTITYFVIPVFGAGLAEAQVTAAQASFGIGQLSTAAIGSVIFFICWQAVQRVPELMQKKKEEKKALKAEEKAEKKAAKKAAKQEAKQAEE